MRPGPVVLSGELDVTSHSLLCCHLNYKRGNVIMNLRGTAAELFPHLTEFGGPQCLNAYFTFI